MTNREQYFNDKRLKINDNQNTSEIYFNESTMETNEMQLIFHENQWKSMKVKESSRKSMEINEMQ